MRLRERIYTKHDSHPLARKKLDSVSLTLGTFLSDDCSVVKEKR